MAVRPLNKCRRCSNTWYPRGKNVSRACPDCGSREVEVVRYKPSLLSALFGIVVLAGIAIVMLPKVIRTPETPSIVEEQEPALDKGEPTEAELPETRRLENNRDPIPLTEKPAHPIDSPIVQPSEPEQGSARATTAPHVVVVRAGSGKTTRAYSVFGAVRNEGGADETALGIIIHLLGKDGEAITSIEAECEKILQGGVEAPFKAKLEAPHAVIESITDYRVEVLGASLGLKEE